jgi:quinolinate synthase
MKKIRLADIANSLEHMYLEIKMTPEEIASAAKSLERMVNS